MLIPVMIPNMEDELMYSWMIRLAKANGFDNTEASALRLFSKLYIHPDANNGGKYEPHYDCHDDISAFLMATGMPMDKIPEFYLNTNIYNGIAPFMQPMRQSNYINRSVYPNDLGFDTLIHKFGNSEIRNVYICPECAKEDIKNNGFFYLHRMHHLPNVKCCAKHHCSLHKYNGVKSYELEDVSNYEDINLNIKDSDVRYASFYKDFLNAKIETHSEEVALAVRTKINNMGYTKPDYPKLAKKIINEGYDNLFDNDIQHFLDLSLTGVRGHSLNFSMYMALMCYVFKDVQEFIDILETDTSTEDKFYDNILENDYSLLCKYNNSIVTMRNNVTGNIFMVNPYGFNAGWIDPMKVSDLDEATMYEIIVDKITNGEYSMVSDFERTGDKITLIHNVCGRHYSVRAGAFILNNSRCKCEKNLTIEKAQARLDESSGGEYKILSYTNQHEDCTVEHKCGQKITKMYSLIQRYPICPICTPIERQAKHEESVRRAKERSLEGKHDRVSANLKPQKIHDEEFFSKQIKELVGDEYELVGTFDSVQDNTEILHHNCEQIIKMSPSAFIQGRRCACQEMLKGKDFEDYVEYASNSLYRINTRYKGKQDKMEIINTKTKEKQVMKKCKIAQELSRPSDSIKLPCENRNMDKSPYVDTNTTIVIKALKKQFKEKDVFRYQDIDISVIPLTDIQIRVAITALMRYGKLFKVTDGNYCLSNKPYNTYDIVYNRYCTKEGVICGSLRGKSLYEYTKGLPLSNPILVRSNIGKNTKSGRDFIGDTVISPTKPKIEFTPDNVYILITIEFARLSINQFSEILQDIRKYVKENNVSLDDCKPYLDKMVKINSKNYTSLLWNLERIYDLSFTKPVTKKPIDYQQKEWIEFFKKNYPVNTPICPELVKRKGKTQEQIRTALEKIAKKGEVINLAIGIYVLKGSNITLDECLYKKYVLNNKGEHIGYDTFDTFLYNIGLLKDKPDNTYVMSNLRLDRAKRHSLKIHREDSELYVRSPKYAITEDNYRILPMLDFLVKYPNHISYDPIKEIRKYADNNGITYDMCLPYVKKYRDIVAGRLKQVFDIK